MRKCVFFAVLTIAAVFFALPGQASAQGIFFGGGVSFPTGDYGEYANAGYTIEAGVTFPVNENGLNILIDGLYGSNSHDETSLGYETGAKTKLFGFLGGLEYSFAEEGEAGAFLFGEAGGLRHKYMTDQLDDQSEWGFAWGGGLGYGFPFSDSMGGWLLGRFLQGMFDGEDGNTSMFGISAGVNWALSGQ